jgi:hypothetical protein
LVEDDQSYMEYTVADDTPQRQQRQQPVVPTISVEPDCDDDMTVLTFDESYMTYNDKDDDKDTTTTSVLRAASSDSQSMSSRSGHFSGTSVSSLNVPRAAELDYLVEWAGDWEGLVLAAAAKYEVSGSDSISTSASGSGAYPSVSAASSPSSSKAKTREELRAQDDWYDEFHLKRLRMLAR